MESSPRELSRDLQSGRGGEGEGGYPGTVIRKLMTRTKPYEHEQADSDHLSFVFRHHLYRKLPLRQRPLPGRTAIPRELANVIALVSGTHAAPAGGISSRLAAS
jgi:hypothetical protein